MQSQPVPRSLASEDSRSWNIRHVEFFQKKKYRHLQSCNLERDTFLQEPNNRHGLSIKRESRVQEVSQGLCISVMLVLLPEINSSTPLPPQLAREASKWLQCSPNTNNLHLQMRNGHLRAPAGRLCVSQPFMEMPKKATDRPRKCHLQEMCCWSGCISAIGSKGLAFLSVEPPLNHRTFRRKKGLKLGSKVKKE